MATCNQVAAFLEQVSAKTVTDRLPEDDLAGLEKLGVVRRLSSADVQAIQQQVAELQTAQLEISQHLAERQQAAGAIAADTKKSHSILFHLEGVDEQHSVLERLQQEGQALKTLDDEIARHQQAFAQLLVNRALLESVGAYNGGFVAITTPGRMVLRDLTARLYRVGDQSFTDYWADATRVDDELTTIAGTSARMIQPMTDELHDVERSYLWAVAIGLVKAGGDPAERLRLFFDAYERVADLSDNLENRLMAGEILAALPRPIDDLSTETRTLLHEVGELGVADEARLGVAAILVLGRRADGTYATESLRQFLTVTASCEAAALLAIQNVDLLVLSQKFAQLKGLFASWGYSASEDTELSSAFLATSDLPVESVSPKLAILTRGLSGYLAFPLVASAILASIPVLEANETLNLMEKAYEILGQRTGPMPQAELISLAVRTVHGVDVRSVNALDPTAAAPPSAPTPAGFSYVGIPPRLWLPVLIAHNSYYSTFSGIGGVHPGHVHAWGGGGFTG